MFCPNILPANFGAILAIVRNLLAIAQLSRNTFRYNHLQTLLFFITLHLMQGKYYGLPTRLRLE